jgi:hypothetical protein
VEEPATGDLAGRRSYSTVFGNQQVGHAWWWDLQGTAWLRMRFHWNGPSLPACAGAVGEWCSIEPMIRNALIWQPGSWGRNRNEIHLTVRLTDTLDGMEAIANQAFIGSVSLMRISVDHTNNVATYEAYVALPLYGG